MMTPDECFEQARTYGELLLSPRYRVFHRDDMVARGISAAELAKNAQGALGKLGPLLAAVGADAGDHASRLELAEALAAAGQPDPAVDHLLHIVKAAPTWRDGAGRLTLLRVLDSLGPAHPAAVRGRKQLSKLLFR